MTGNDGSLTQQLRSLKVADLKHIATNCNLRVHGKKADLVERLSDSAIAPLVVAQLEQMSSGDFAPLGWKGPSGVPIEQTSALRSRKRRLESSQQAEPKCLCKGLPPATSSTSYGDLSIVHCPKCQNPYHDQCVGLYSGVTEEYSTPGVAPPAFLCPRCRLEDLDPFYSVMKILYLISLFDAPHDMETQRVLPLQSPNIQELRRKGCEVFIMCLRLTNLKNPLIHEWPWTMSATINKNVEKVKKPEYEHKRRDVPMKITPFLFGNTSNDIRIQAEKAPNPPADDVWAVSVVLCSAESVDTIEANVLAKNRLPYDVAKALTMNNIDKFFGKKPTAASIEGGEALSDEEDDEDEVDIVDTSCKVRLLDPITLTRLRVPVRGRHCKHLECFDLNSFLNVTKNSKAFANRWKCVVCNQFTRPKDLVIDTFLESLLHQTSADAEAVVFDAAGQWQELKIKWVADDTVVGDDDDEVPKARTAPAAALAGAIDIIDDDDETTPEDLPINLIMKAVLNDQDQKRRQQSALPPPSRAPVSDIPSPVADLVQLGIEVVSDDDDDDDGGGGEAVSPKTLGALPARFDSPAALSVSPLTSSSPSPTGTGMTHPLFSLNEHKNLPDVSEQSGYGPRSSAQSIYRPLFQSEQLRAPIGMAAMHSQDLWSMEGAVTAPPPPPRVLTDPTRTPATHQQLHVRNHAVVSHEQARLSGVASPTRTEEQFGSSERCGATSPVLARPQKSRHVDMTFGNWQGPAVQQGAAPPR